MTDQPTQADRERALTVARSLSACAFGDELTLALCHLATHAENERLRAHTLSQTKRIHSLLQTVYSVRALASCGEAAIASEIEKRLTEYDRIMYGNQTQEPKMTETQAETGPSDEPEAFAKWFREWQTRYEKGEPTFHEAFDAGYTAGRASLAGELAELRKYIDAEREKRKLIHAELEAEKAAHAETRKQADRFAERLRLIACLQANAAKIRKDYP